MTKTSTQNNTAESTSSAQTEPCKQSQNVINLGKLLIRQLNLGDDSLSSWIAHYIAELIEKAETSKGIAKEKAQTECLDTILKLWANRQKFSHNYRPLEDFEPVFRTLAKLDPEKRGQLPIWNNAKTDATELDKWLGLAEQIDDISHDLIRYCLTQALEHVEQNSEEWLAISEAIGTIPPDIEVIRILLADYEKLEGESPTQTEINHLKSLLDKLTTFQSAAKDFLQHLKAKKALKAKE